MKQPEEGFRYEEGFAYYHCIIVIAVLLIIGKIIMSGEASELEKNIIRSVKQGNYYAALEDAEDIEFKGEKMSKKVSRLIEDLKLYGAAQKEMEKYSEMNLGKVKTILDEMNGNYKDYDIFEADIEKLKEKVETLEEYGNEGLEVAKEVGALIEDGEIEEARGKINEYMADERYEYMPESLQSTFYDYMLQINFR